jgi:hypothetical protein
MKRYLQASGLLAAGVTFCAVSLTAQAAEPDYYQAATTNAAAGQTGAAGRGTQASQTAVTVGANGNGKFSVFAETIFLQPVNNQLQYALKMPAPLGGEPIPANSELESVGTNFSPGFRAGASMTVGNTGMDIAASFSYLKSKSVSRVSKPAGGAIGPIRFHPSLGRNAADSASGKYDLDNIVVDLEVGQKLTLGSSLGMRLFGGLRYASMKTRLKATYIGGDFVFLGNTRGVATDKSDMSGFGPRFGSSLMWSLPAGFSIGGDVAGSLLIGNIDFGHREVDQFGVEVDIEEKETAQIFPVVESKLALGWQMQFTDRLGMSVEAGYRYQVWFNTQGNMIFSDDVGPTALDNKRSDIGLHGPFLKAAMSF